METRYVSFEPGRLAAVELVNRPWFFARFAASIRHRDIAGGSEICYKFRFSSRPRLLEPWILSYLRRETGRRLDALARAVAGDRVDD
jgi:hypothetical protein